MPIYGLLIKSAGLPDRFFPLGSDPIRIGRSRGQDIILPGSSVSKAHAEVVCRDDAYLLEDVGSTNGTFVNEERVASHPLKIGDVIRIGDFTLAFSTYSLDGSAGAEGAVSVSSAELFVSGDTLVDMTEELGLHEMQTKVVLESGEQPDDIQKAYQRLCVMYEVTHQIAGFLDLPQLLKRISEVVVNVLKTERCVILLRDESTGEPVPMATSWGADVDPKASPVLLSRTMVDEVLRSGRCMVTRDAQSDALLKDSDSVLMGGIHSALCVPLRNKDQIVGIIYCDNRRTELKLVGDDLQLLAGISQQAQLAVENARLFDQLRRRQDQLIRSEKMAALGRLAGGIAHQIRNPLTAIIGFSQVYGEKLEEGGLAALDAQKLKEYFNSMVQQAKRCNAIAENLLLFSRRSPAEPHPISVNDAIGEVLAILEFELVRRGVKIVTELDPQIPAITGDPAQLRQAFMNMITNAKEAMPEGGTLTIQTAAEEGGVAIRFSDTGPGIPPNLLERIFEPLFSTKPEGAGTGLGLFVSRQIVDTHHGTLRAESRQGEGSSFVMRLPAAGEKAEGAPRGGQSPTRRSVPR
ncbi:MAG: FHA domain-containing protein [Kiritimatiellae bacterium]|nr:FHA domain-containing protein [Kiritimatiellia bacterium]